MADRRHQEPYNADEEGSRRIDCLPTVVPSSQAENEPRGV